jgi:hypothetical protein
MNYKKYLHIIGEEQNAWMRFLLEKEMGYGKSKEKNSR